MVRKLADMNTDRVLDREEYIIARFMIDTKLSGQIIPNIIPPQLIQSVYDPTNCLFDMLTYVS